MGGGAKVAEITGRKERLIRSSSGNSIVLEKRIRPKQACLADLKTFMDDQKVCERHIYCWLVAC
jgi:hypothetical protein